MIYYMFYFTCDRSFMRVLRGQKYDTAWLTPVTLSKLITYSVLRPSKLLTLR